MAKSIYFLLITTKYLVQFIIALQETATIDLYHHTKEQLRILNQTKLHFFYFHKTCKLHIFLLIELIY